MSMKNAMKPSGNELANFWFLAHCWWQILDPPNYSKMQYAFRF